MNKNLTLLVFILGATAACSSGSDGRVDAGATGGTGADAGTGGMGGVPAGSGGASNTGGLGGAMAAGGSGGAQVGGAGGAQVGGAGGAQVGGAGGAQVGGAGGAGSGGSPGAGGAGGTSVPNPDDCFAGLRAGEDLFQVATKESADMKYRMRLALETAGRFGTSGTRPWSVYRVALQTPDGNVCITDESALGTAYQGSRHNCSDKLTLTVGSKRYVIDNPDTAVDVVDPTTWGRPATLTIFVNNQSVGGPVRLDTVACHGGICGSGGPCL